MEDRVSKQQHFLRALIACALATLVFSIHCFAQQTTGESLLKRNVGASVRLETLPIDDGAELVTLFFTAPSSDGAPPTEIPLVSVLRDTLGNRDPEVHRLRYLWVHTYTAPSLRQRFAAGIPFMYSRFGNARTTRNRASSPVMDLSNEGGRLWKTLLGLALKGSFLDLRASLLVSAIRTYDRNLSSYVTSQLASVSIG